MELNESPAYTPRKPKPTNTKLKVDFCGIPLKNPVCSASGTFASGKEYSSFVDVSALGAVTTKGTSLNGWSGNETPRICEVCSGMLNSIGLQNPGVRHLIDYDLAWLNSVGATVFINVSGHTFDEYRAVIEALENASGSGKVNFDAYELNISCPNVDAGGMSIGLDAHLSQSLVEVCKKASRHPLIVKLTPNVGDIAEIARAVEYAGADALSLINTVLGMAVDAKTKRPRLARVVGGMSGPAIKPIALRMVWECHKAVNIPLLGMGGICSGEDAIEFMLAGASAVSVGTANFYDPESTIRIIDEIADFCEGEGIADINSLIGSLQC